MQYYQLAQNVHWFWTLHRTMQLSLLKTLANKQNSTVRHMRDRFGATVTTPDGVLNCLEARVLREGRPPLVARFGGIPLRRRQDAILLDLPVTIARAPERNELIHRLLADRCELCGSRERVQVHHVRRLADLKPRGRVPAQDIGRLPFMPRGHPCWTAHA